MTLHFYELFLVAGFAQAPAIILILYLMKLTQTDQTAFNRLIHAWSRLFIDIPQGIVLLAYGGLTFVDISHIGNKGLHPLTLTHQIFHTTLELGVLAILTICSIYAIEIAASNRTPKCLADILWFTPLKTFRGLLLPTTLPFTSTYRMPTLNELRAAIPQTGIETIQLVSHFRHAARRDPSSFATLVEQAGYYHDAGTFHYPIILPRGPTTTGSSYFWPKLADKMLLQHIVQAADLLRIDLGEMVLEAPFFVGEEKGGEEVAVWRPTGSRYEARLKEIYPEAAMSPLEEQSEEVLASTTKESSKVIVSILRHPAIEAILEQTLKMRSTSMGETY